MLDTSSTQSASASPTTRKGPLGHPAVLLLAGVAVLLGAYALGYLKEFGVRLEDAMHSTQSSDVTALSPAFYGIAALATFLILLGLLKSFYLLFGKLRGVDPRNTRPAKPVEQFIEEASARNIGLRVARESYYLLEPYYPYRMCIDLNDDLRSDLRLAEDEVRALESQLLTRCDRREAPVTAATPARHFVTVFDLLHRAETAPPLREDRSGARNRIADSPGAPQKHDRRLSDSAERKALHTATLHAIESGSLHTDGPSGLNRRDSDYTGPRRRTTDTRVDPVYKGPFQRATDKPRTLSGERKVQPTPDTAELNRHDTLFLAPRNKRIPEPKRTA